MHRSTLCVIGALPLLFGCVASTGLYDYGKYSQLQYHMHKDATPEAFAKYEEEVLRLIEKAQKKGMKVPPGLFAEYAYLQGLKGDSATAAIYFQKEVELYPESQKYVDFLRGISSPQDVPVPQPASETSTQIEE